MDNEIFVDEEGALDENAIQFQTTGPATVSCDGLVGKEEIPVLIKKVGGGFQRMTCDNSSMVLKAMNNTVFLPGKGTYSLDKGITKQPVSAGYNQ